MNLNKKNRKATIIGGAAILAISGLLFIQEYRNHQANQLIIEKCFTAFGKEREAVIKKNGLWSKVTCEIN
ncbi:hypothetical protein GKZ89_11495 [Bacillus mangrovi]|uniref:Uncharacterized protein n=1 Tax=Metabacillus mangrovi TaxID=1491830 RepID=A0A7X2S5K3_9BACI|nr:hypothetical protein [Metabacillus mangrovi]MTH54032.1 hypothetical protein [Metabacillus mangrovi]